MLLGVEHGDGECSAGHCQRGHGVSSEVALEAADVEGSACDQHAKHAHRYAAAARYTARAASVLITAFPSTAARLAGRHRCAFFGCPGDAVRSRASTRPLLVRALLALAQLEALGGGALDQAEEEVRVHGALVRLVEHHRAIPDKDVRSKQTWRG